MEERHEVEQYFFTSETSARLARFAAGFENPCCLCAPTVGEELLRLGVRARVLDIDERFADTPGFRLYDMYRPQPLHERFGLILCDPPFSKVTLSQLFAAVRILSGNCFEQPLLIFYPRQRAANLLGTFARFGLGPTGYHPTYVSVKALERNEIELFGNLSHKAYAALVDAP